VREFRARRKLPGWFSAQADRIRHGAEALTVAGQWRSFTAFPSILAIAVIGLTALLRSGLYDMELTSMPSTFINRTGGNVKIWTNT
jgi:hypothetical protein